MSNSRAKTGDIAAKAGASAGGPAASAEGSNAAEGAGKAELTGEQAANPAENADNPTQKQAEIVADVVKKASETIETVVKDAAELKKDENLTKVKILRSHPAYAYHPGEQGELPAEKAAELIASGHAVQVSEDGQQVAPAYPHPTASQLNAASLAYGRFVAASAEARAADFLTPDFADLPAEMQCCFVAAIDPTYGPQA